MTAASVNGMVKLELVDPFDLEPMLDKALQGRLAKVLKDAGSQGRISVRSRMITSVASTKYSTLDGHPVSLVGVHGKDEILVRGPSWAIEMLADGQGITDLGEIRERFSKAEKKLEEYLLRFESLDAKLDDYRALIGLIKVYEEQPEMQLVESVYGGLTPIFETQLLSYSKAGAELKLLRESAQAYLRLREQITPYRAAFEEAFSNSISIDNIELYFHEAADHKLFLDVRDAIKSSLERCHSILEQFDSGAIPWWFGLTTAVRNSLESLEEPIKPYVADEGCFGPRTRRRREMIRGHNELPSTFFDYGMGMGLHLPKRACDV